MKTENAGNAAADIVVESFIDSIIKLFCRADSAPWAASLVPLIVIYERPMDYPDRFVARLWATSTPTNYVAFGESLEEVRKSVLPGMRNIGRNGKDDPCIVEVWV